jgi:hypothetical protein
MQTSFVDVVDVVVAVAVVGVGADVILHER